MLLKITKKNLPEGPFEASNTFGIDIMSVLKSYVKNRNSILKLLRVYDGTSLSEVAKHVGITEQELLRYEKSDSLIDYKLVPKFAKVFNVDLKTLLVLFGHAKPESLGKDKEKCSNFSIAAQYSGPELTDKEKLDLEKLFKLIIEKRKRMETNM